MVTVASKLISKTSPLLHRLRRHPLPLLFSGKTLIRSIHDSPSNTNPCPNPNSDPNTNHETLPSRFLQPITTNSPAPPSAVETEEDATMNEFLSRFVHSIRGKISEAYPGLPRDTRDSMLLIICQTVVDRLDSGAEADGPPMDLSEDLWKTILDVSASVNEAMRRDRVRAELRKYMDCDEVKQMCRFAGEVGIRGDFLRELRFKWAREKMDEVEFYKELERMREQAKKEEELEKGLITVSERPKIMALPLRKGKIRYKIYGLDMSDPKWAEVSERLQEAEKHVVPEEARPVVGRSKRVEDKIMGLDPEKDDLKPAFKEFEEALSARRVDWLSLLDRIKEHNEDLYLKV
ncbi:protein NUCLEAR FUSION DEFECTIVE 5, mitochondrial-like [Phalaenopsis equestris]|uniref:protein NUCLEAR FUSION DEFECTIVE 5, mitochondrial-like n=1 Tax=Phalaenopsis equestris TaxID=78828 RepID=UPI0009E47892|nr:protein NUCLEAR FUSION DEFECTIVE 5, mitochondrial-like [Phalaenopsis equestris]